VKTVQNITAPGMSELKLFIISMQCTVNQNCNDLPQKILITTVLNLNSLLKSRFNLDSTESLQ